MKKRETIDDILELPPSPERDARLRAMLNEPENTAADDDGGDDFELSPEWEAELARRVADLDSGRAETKSIEEAMADVRARLAAKKERSRR